MNLKLTRDMSLLVRKKKTVSSLRRHGSDSYKYVPLRKLGNFHKLKHIQKKTEKVVKGVSQTTKLFGEKGVSHLREIA